MWHTDETTTVGFGIVTAGFAGRRQMQLESDGINGWDHVHHLRFLTFVSATLCHGVPKS